MFLAASAQRHQPPLRDVRQRGRGHGRCARLDPDDYARTWYRQNPPLPRVSWSQRNNNNYQQTGLLVSLHYFAENAPTLPAQLLPEEQALDREAEARGAGRLRLPAPTIRARGRRRSCCASCSARAARSRAPPRLRRAGAGAQAEEGRQGQGDHQARRRAAGSKPKTETRRFPAGSYLVRMDQPYSRVADMLLDYQYWSPDDPQKQPYDDTGWTFGELFGVAGGARRRSRGAGRRRVDTRDGRGRGAVRA